MLTLEQLAALVDSDEIDTVIVAITDMQGRLQGKRFHARHFLDEVVKNGTEGCNYLLAVDVEMNTVDGYEMSSWARGYGDFAMTPDFARCAASPWHPGTAMVLANLGWLDTTTRRCSPRRGRSCRASSAASPRPATAPTPAPSSSSSCTATPTRTRTRGTTTA
jgi:glutamine synthetase